MEKGHRRILAQVNPMELYFRVKENGATVFRISDENRHKRMDLQPIAEANLRNKDIKTRNNVTLTDAEENKIKAWIRDRRAQLAGRELEDARQTIEKLNAAATWISGKPDPEAARETVDQLLLAMHDLRSAIVRYKSKAIQKDEDE